MIKQIIFDMRHHRMMTWISIVGTAVSIFLVMVFYMSDNARLAAVEPEQDRERIVVGAGIDIHSTDPDNHSSSSGGMTYETARRLYGNLDGVEKISYISSWYNITDIILKGTTPVRATIPAVDGAFWDIYHFKFIEGHPFTNADCESTERKIVLNRTTAHKVFGSTDVIGREVKVKGVPYTVAGVVEDVNPLLPITGVDAYVSLSEDEYKPWGTENAMVDKLGHLRVLLLLKEGVDPESIRTQVRSRYAALNAELEKDMYQAVYHESPFDLEVQVLTMYGGNSTPDLTSHRRKRIVMYTLLLLLPAINLSSLMRGRLRHRVSELGVRRAFGTKRSRIVSQLLGENFIVTLTGGLIGLLLSIIFMLTLSSVFFNFIDYYAASSLEVMLTNPSLSMVFTWKAFFIALGACLVLNILTATLHAWRASMISPAAAISKSRI